MSDIGIKSSLNGSDFNITSDENVQFDSNKSYAKIDGPHTSTIYIGTSLGGLAKKVTIPHGLSYIPMVIVVLDFIGSEVSYDVAAPVTWYNVTGLTFMTLPFFQHMVGTFEVAADSTNIYISTESDWYRNVKMSYYIVREDIL